MLKKKCLLVFIALVFFGKLPAQIPEGYYNSIDGKQLWDLKTALHRILKNHTRLSYNSMWYYYHTTDVCDDGYTVWDMYSNNVRYFSENPSGSTSGMEREHSFPKSWWAESDQVSKYDAYSDLHHLYPADGPANQAKSNHILDEVTGRITFYNNVTKVGASGHASLVFEPADEYKGDFARAYFYIITCYEDYAPQWRSEGLYMLNNETSQVLKPWAKDLLMKWHRNDPVSAKELMRNEAVYGHQGNRNPYIDFPNIAEYFWGDSVGYVFTLPEDIKAKDPVLITPAPSSAMYFGETLKDQEIETTIPVKGVAIKSNLSVRLFSNESGAFSLAPNSIPSILVNSDNGYALKIRYKPSEYGEHTARLSIYDGGLEGSVSVSLKGTCVSELTDGIVPIGSHYADLYTEKGAIIYRSYAPNDRVSILDLQGKVVHQTLCSGEWERYSVPASSIYIVRVNQVARKVFVR